MTEAQDIAERYVALWNERDSGTRRSAIAAFFAPTGEHYVGTRSAKGYDELEKRVLGSHTKNVVEGGYLFRAVAGAQKLQDVVTFNWEMHPVGDAESTAAVGLEFVVLGDDGRVVTDYQFIVR